MQFAGPLLPDPQYSDLSRKRKITDLSDFRSMIERIISAIETVSSSLLALYFINISMLYDAEVVGIISSCNYRGIWHIHENGSTGEPRTYFM